MAETCLEAGEQLTWLDRFGDVVVCSELESDDPVDDVDASCNEQNRKLGSLSNLSEKIDALAVWQAPVEQHPVDGAARERALRRRDRADGDDGITLALEQLTEGRGNGRIVFGDEQRCHEIPRGIRISNVVGDE